MFVQCILMTLAENYEFVEELKATIHKDQPKTPSVPEIKAEPSQAVWEHKRLL